MTAVWLERHVKPETVNEMIAYPAPQRRRITREWRAWAADVARESGWPPIAGEVTVTVHHIRPNRAALPDVGAPFLVGKACIDGLVDAGVLPGDGPDVVRRLTCEAPEVLGWHGLRVIVRPIEAHSIRPQPASGQITIGEHP